MTEQLIATKTETNFSEMVCGSAREFALLVGVSDRTVSNWKLKGMPHQPGNPSPIPVAPAIQWLRSNNLLGKSGQNSIGYLATGAAKTSDPGQAVFDEMDSAASSGNWSRALQLFLIDVDTFKAPATIEDIAVELEDFGSCLGGSVAIRIAKTRVYVWGGLQRDFANAFVAMVNVGMIYARINFNASPDPTEDSPWSHRLDLPLVKDLAKPPKSDCRVDLAFSQHPEGAIAVELETVTKPKLPLIDPADGWARQSALHAIANFEGLRTAKARKDWLDSVATELKKARKAAGSK